MTQSDPVAPRKNSRKSPRRLAMSNIQVRAYPNTLGLGKNLASRLLDLSESGIRLILRETIPTGKEIEIFLENPSGITLKMIGKIIWSVETADGQYCVGTQLNKSLTGTQVASMVKP